MRAYFVNSRRMFSSEARMSELPFHCSGSRWLADSFSSPDVIWANKGTKSGSLQPRKDSSSMISIAWLCENAGL